MSLLSNLATDNNINNEQDSVGGGGVWDSALYPVTVDMAYIRKSAGGALGLNLVLKNDKGQEHRETLWVASGDKKGNKNYYENSKGERHYLPGFNHANSIALLSLGKDLSELDTEVKTLRIYSPEAGKEVPTDVDVVTDLLGQRVIVGIQKQIVDKNKKNDQTGAYEPTGETREVNEIDKVFRERDNMTTAEILAQEDEPKFYQTWEKKWTGVVRNRATAANDANGASQGAPRAAAGGGAPAPKKGSLFS